MMERTEAAHRAQGTLAGGRARNTLGLDDDLDGVDLVRDVKDIFGVQFSPCETEACRTVGDIFGLLKARFSAKGMRNQGCASAMTFYRLRRALKAAGCSLTMAPSSRLDQISTVPPKVLFREIQTHSALRLPRLKYAACGVAGCCIVLLSIAALPAVAIVNSRHFCFLFPLGTMLTGGILIHVDQNKFPSECATLGDLARKVAGLNFGRLVTFGAKPRDADLWAALLELLTEHSLIKKAAITTETILLQTQLRAAS